MNIVNRWPLVAVIALAGTASASLPPATLTTLYRNGNNVIGVGQINSPFNFTSGQSIGGTTFLGVATNDLAQTFVNVGIFAPPPFTTASLLSTQGLIPYLSGGYLPPDAGSIGLPTSDYAVTALSQVDVNNSGTPVFVVRLGQGDFGPVVPPTSGIARGTQSLVAQEGTLVNVAGVNAAATYRPFTNAVVCINDNNQILFGASILESGLTRRVLIRVTTDGSGNTLSKTLIAKEGGPVGAGPATWTAISIAPNSAALNNAGQVVFSGVTSTGVEGVFKDSVLVAQRGGSTPAGGLWGALLGTPVDINASGRVAFRGLTGDGLWVEAADAGETYATSNQTIQGTLTNITGSLSSDHDIDVYRIRIADFSTFSATTVPSPGFTGSSGDTVLYLFHNFQNLNSANRVALSRGDDTSPNSPQSTLTAGNLDNSGSAPGEYYLAVATPKARPVTDTGGEFWLEDPASLAISGGKIYWTDPSEGTVRRADLATGVLDATTYPVSLPPAPYAGQISGTGEMALAPLAVADAPAVPTIFWQTTSYGDNRLRSSPVAGFSKTDLITGPANPSIEGLSSLAVDNTGGKVYWSRPDVFSSDARGVLNRANLNGTSSEVLLLASTGERPRYLAVDSAGGKIYWYDSANSVLKRANLNASSIEVLVSPLTGVGGLAVDPAGGKVYWSVPSTGIIERASLTGASRETFKSGLNTTSRKYFSGALAIASGNLYYADVRTRSILKMSTASLNPAATTLVSVGRSLNDRGSDSPEFLNQNFGGWQRDGAAVNTAIPYQVKLTGANAFNQQAIISIDNTVKVAGVTDVIPTINASALTEVGSATSPVRLSDNGLAAYFYRVQPPSGSVTGIALGTDKVVDSASVPSNGIGLGIFDPGTAGFDMSRSGQYIVSNTSSFVVYPPRFGVHLTAFDSVPVGAPTSCNPADICGSGATYINGLVDIGPDQQLTVDDFVVFLSAFSDATGCPGSTPCNPADICGSGATYINGTVDIPPDGDLSIDDFVVFLSAFSDSTGCL